MLWFVFCLFFPFIYQISNIGAEKKPVAILHVGPEKTGSSWLQKLIFFELSIALQQENYFTIPRNYVKAHLKKNTPFAVCATPIIAQSHCSQLLDNYRKEIKNNLYANKNIILSSEGLANADVDLKIVFSMLEGYEIRVIVVYRELLSLLLSAHNQLGKHFENELPTYKQFSNRDWLIDRTKHFSGLKVVERIKPYISANQLFIFDYYGMIETGKDISEIILLTSIPELSNSTKKVFHEKLKVLKSNGHINKKVDLRFFDLFWFVKKKFSIKNTHSHKFLNCFQDQLKSNNSNYLNTEKNCLTVVELFPIRCVLINDLIFFQKLSIDEDTKIREIYNDRIFYGNATANLLKTNNFKISIDNDLCSINIDEVEKSEKFHEILNKIVLHCHDNKSI